MVGLSEASAFATAFPGSSNSNTLWKALLAYKRSTCSGVKPACLALDGLIESVGSFNMLSKAFCADWASVKSTSKSGIKENNSFVPGFFLQVSSFLGFTTKVSIVSPAIAGLGFTWRSIISPNESRSAALISSSAVIICASASVIPPLSTRKRPAALIWSNRFAVIKLPPLNAWSNKFSGSKASPLFLSVAVKSLKKLRVNTLFLAKVYARAALYGSEAPSFCPVKSLSKASLILSSLPAIGSPFFLKVDARASNPERISKNFCAVAGLRPVPFWK